MSKLIKSTNSMMQNELRKTIGLKEVTVQDPFFDGSSLKENNIEEALELKKKELRSMQANIQAEKLQLEEERLNLQIEVQKTEEKMEEIAAEKYRLSAEEGYNQGFHEGLEKGKNEYLEKIDQANRVIDAAKADYLVKLEEAEPVMILLAVKLAKKIIGEELSGKPVHWEHLIKKALAEVQEQEEVKVYVHPTQYEKTLSFKKELVNIVTHARELFIYADDRLNEHDCVIETPFGQVHASVDSQLKEIQEELLKRLKEGAATHD